MVWNLSYRQALWGQRYRQSKPVLLSGLQLSGKLRGYFADIDKQSKKMYEILVKQAAECDDVTEQLKEFDKMKKAKEIVNTDLIYN